MGSIEKRGRNSWRIGVQVDGQWVRRSIRCPAAMTDTEQRRMAKRELVKLQVDIDAGRVIPKNAMTVSDFAKMYIKEHVIPNTSESNRVTYQNLLDTRVLPRLGDVRLNKLTPLLLTQFMNELKVSPKRTTLKAPGERKREASPSDELRSTAKHRDTNGQPEYLAPRTVRHYYRLLKGMFNKAVDWELLTDNPMKKVTPPTVPKAKIKYLTDEQAVELIKKVLLDDRRSFRAAVLLALTCGLRLGEVGALRLSDVDWENGTIEISKALKYSARKGNYEGPTKTDASNSTITLPPLMLEVLQEIKEHQEYAVNLIGDRWYGERHIVCTWDGLPLHHDTPSKWFKDFVREYGDPEMVFHGLRHSHATILFAANIDAVTVAERMRHSNPYVTMNTYAHLVRKRDQQSALVMQDLMVRAEIGDDSQQSDDT